MDQGSQETQRIRAAKRPVLELSPMSAMFGVVSVNASEVFKAGASQAVFFK